MRTSPGWLCLSLVPFFFLLALARQEACRVRALNGLEAMNAPCPQLLLGEGYDATGTFTYVGDLRMSAAVVVSYDRVASSGFSLTDCENACREGVQGCSESCPTARTVTTTCGGIDFSASTGNCVVRETGVQWGDTQTWGYASYSFTPDATTAPTAAPTATPTTEGPTISGVNASYSTYNTGQWCKDSGNDDQDPESIALALVSGGEVISGTNSEAACQAECDSCNGYVHDSQFSCACEYYTWKSNTCYHFKGTPVQCTANSAVASIRKRSASTPTSSSNNCLAVADPACESTNTCVGTAHTAWAYNAGVTSCKGDSEFASGGFPVRFLVHYQQEADGTGFCHLFGDTTQALFDDRAPALASTEVATKCTSFARAYHDSLGLGVMRYYNPVSGEKRCNSQKLLHLASGWYFAHCQMFKAVSCHQRRCEATSCETHKAVRCVEVCPAVDDADQAELHITYADSLAYGEQGYRIWSASNSGRQAQKMKKDPASSCVACSNDAELYCNQVAMFE